MEGARFILIGPCNLCNRRIALTETIKVREQHSNGEYSDSRVCRECYLADENLEGFF